MNPPRKWPRTAGSILRPPKGFTLIELLIAMAVFGLSVAAFTGSLVTGMRANRVAQEISEATTLAQNRLEQSPTADSDETPVPGTIFTRRTRIEPNYGGTGARKITVTVSWRDGGTRTIELQTVRRVSP